ncbi:MAG TPA: biotin/lipoyl-binding protein, partial [Terriglobia bacterium]|nr:biotin/lipoyl-binding protein [Terriglobia bacterium]
MRQHRPPGGLGQTPLALGPAIVRLGVLAALVLLLGTLSACSRKPAGDEDEKPGEESSAVAEVSETKVVRADITSSLAVTGVIAALPNQDVKVSALVPGRIARMMAAEGERVAQGAMLAKIEDRPFLDQIQQAEGAVEQAKANLENARLNRDRNESLFQRGIAARKDLEDA